jgi:hypothetical protein
MSGRGESPAKVPSTEGADRGASPRKTPAGCNENVNWASFRDAVAGLFVFLNGIPTEHIPWHVVFRCGTVVAFNSLAEAEFAGYDAGDSAQTPAYVFPEHRVADARVVSRIMDDNRRAWEAQRELPGDVGHAIRIGYAKLVKQGYPYPGGPRADRTPIDSGVALEAKQPGDSMRRLWFITWPNLSDGAGWDSLKIFNLALSEHGAEVAVVEGGDLRRYDYMFPEVGAVITPENALWTYSPSGAFELVTPLTENSDPALETKDT